jgi:hypothetical protein
MPSVNFSGADLMIVAACLLAMVLMTLLGPGAADKFDARFPQEQEPYKPVQHRAPLMTVCVIIAASAIVYVLLVIRRFAG